MVAVGCEEFNVAETVVVHPLALVTVNVGVYTPFVAYKKLGFCSVDVSLGFPVKFHNHLTAPVLVSVKLTSIGDWQNAPLLMINPLVDGPGDTVIVLGCVTTQLPKVATILTE